MSMEEERARQDATTAPSTSAPQTLPSVPEGASEPVATSTRSTAAAVPPTSSDATIPADGDSEEDALLAQALALSQEEEDVQMGDASTGDEDEDGEVDGAVVAS